MTCERCDADEGGPCIVFDYHTFLCFSCLNDFEEFQRNHPDFLEYSKLKDRFQVLIVMPPENVSVLLELREEMTELEKRFYFTAKDWAEQKVKRG